jgi:putative nucleotidyltransferase with HDIG domain
VTSPIVFMGKPLGSVVLSINKSVLAEAQARAQKRMIPVVAVVLALGVISSVSLSSLLTRPIKELSSGVEELKKGKRSKPLRVYAQDELGRLTERFNEMTELITIQRESLGRYAQDLEKSYIATVKVLAAAIDARDSYTLGHSTRVAQLSLQLAGEIGLGKEELEELEIACLFHDVGKIRIPDAILHKSGALDLPERQEMMRHTEYGTEILNKAPSLHKFIPAVRHHHEWHDGSGYPDGLSGDKIPLPASIISLADAFDAMTSDRPYRGALTEGQALDQIRELSGKQFNPDLVQSFLKMIERSGRSVPNTGGQG